MCKGAESVYDIIINKRCREQEVCFMDKKMFKVVIAGETRMYPEGTTYREIVDESDIHTEAPVILVMVNGKLRELQKRLKSDCTLEFVTTKDHIGFETYKRSVCLVLLRAIYDVAALPVETNIMDIEEAKKSGAMALFGEKYDQKVRVVSMGDFSRELCGGTHVRNTSSIMLFKIVSEAGVAAGVRRIEALTGNGVIEYYKKQEAMLHEAAKALKAQPAEVAEKIAHLQADVKALQSENESLKSKLAQGSLGDVMNQIVDVKGVKLLASRVEGIDMNGLRDLGDQLKEKIGEGVVVLAAVNGGKVNLLAMATDAAQKAGAHAGNLIKGVAAIVGGGGGGRPNMAQAGGKNPEKAQEAIDAAAGILEQQIH